MIIIGILLRRRYVCVLFIHPTFVSILKPLKDKNKPNCNCDFSCFKCHNSNKTINQYLPIAMPHAWFCVLQLWCFMFCTHPQKGLQILDIVWSEPERGWVDLSMSFLACSGLALHLATPHHSIISQTLWACDLLLLCLVLCSQASQPSLTPPL